MDHGRLRWGIIGLGEAGSTFARHISESARVPVFAADPLLNKTRVPEHMAKRLSGLSVEIIKDIPTLATRCDIIISLVTPGVAGKVAAEAAAALRRGIYIDFNSISPREKQGIAARFREHRYVDGAILGSIAGEGARVKLALSGMRANNARSRLSTLGFNASTVGSQVGAASGVKMCRSIFMKGLECLFVETLVASETFQVTDNVLRSIEETFRAYQLRPMADMLVTTHAAHCRRRSDEMRSAAKMMDQMGIPNRMSKATRDFLAASSRSGVVDHFRGSVPSTSKEVTDYFLDAPRRTRR